VTLSGPELRVLADALVCVTGADLQARWNGKAVDLDAPFEVKTGDHIAFGYARSGARAYLCVQGGLVERRPGEPLRRLAPGDVVTRSRLEARPGSPSPAAPESHRDRSLTLRVLPGPQAGFFPAEAAELRRPSDIPPEGTALGAIQVPASGLPIVLGPDRPVTGGYAKIGTVSARDWPLLAQAAPGTAVRFRATTLAEAWKS
jgi:antagonist of KipI